MQLVTAHKILIGAAIGMALCYAAYSLYLRFWLGVVLALVAAVALAGYLRRFVRAQRFADKSRRS